MAAEQARSGIAIDFIINENYLVAHTLAATAPSQFCSHKFIDDIQAFQRYALSSAQGVTEYIQLNHHDFIFNAENPAQERITADALIAELITAATFNVIRFQTKEFLAALKQNWLRRLEESSTAIKAITGIDFEKLQYTVVVTHPSLCQGMYLGNKMIAWGGIERWENYSVVYLWHEIFHDLLGRSDVSHAIIELLADNELRVRLNGGSYPPFEGHPRLNPLKEKILPHWLEFLGSNTCNIFAFERKMLHLFKEDADSSVW